MTRKIAQLFIAGLVLAGGLVGTGGTAQAGSEYQCVSTAGCSARIVMGGLQYEDAFGSSLFDT